MKKGAECESTNVPNWLDLPRDITVNILQRLDTIDIVASACQVCPLWWNICKDPLIWRTIHIPSVSFDVPFNYPNLTKICRYAVERSCGHLEVIYIAHFGTDDLLECIAENASNLRSMSLVSCQRISDRGFSEAVRKLPQLEEVNISFCNLSKDSLEVLGRSCPLLKSFKFMRTYTEGPEDDGYAIFMEDDDDTATCVIAETMPGSRLCHRNITRNDLTEVGLIAILDGCPLLETLLFEGCHNLISSTDSDGDYVDPGEGDFFDDPYG